MAIAISIQDVLNDWDYTRAYNLLRANTSNPTLLQILEKESVYNTIRLKKELTILQQTQKAVNKITPIDVLEMKFQRPETDDIKKLRAENLHLFKESSALQNRLELMNSDEERKKAAFEILRNFQNADDNWQKIDYWNEFGNMPTHTEKITVVPDDPIYKLKRIQNLRTYIIKARAKGQDDKVKAYQQELEELQK